MNRKSPSLPPIVLSPYGGVNDIVRERRAITPDTALRLACYFGITAQFWLNLPSAYDLKATKLKVGKRIRRKVQAKPPA